MLKKLLAVLGGVVVLLLVAPVVLSSKMRVSRSVEIQRSPAAFQRYFGLMSGTMGRTFEKGLGNLKNQIEKS